MLRCHHYFCEARPLLLWPPFLKAKVVPIWRRPIYSRVNDEGSRSHTRFAEWPKWMVKRTKITQNGRRQSR